MIYVDHETTSFKEENLIACLKGKIIANSKNSMAKIKSSFQNHWINFNLDTMFFSR